MTAPDKKRRNELCFYIEQCESMGFTPAVSSVELRALIDGYKRREAALEQVKREASSLIHAERSVQIGDVRPIGKRFHHIAREALTTPEQEDHGWCNSSTEHRHKLAEQRSEDERWEPDRDLGHDEAHVRELLDEATAIAQTTGQYPASADEALEDVVREVLASGDRNGQIQFDESADTANRLRRALQRPRVPDGWVLVPKEPTQGMIDAAIINDEIGSKPPISQGHDCSDLVDEEECALAVYRAMVNAAPSEGSDYE